MPDGRLITYAAALNEALREEMARDASIFLLGEEIGIWGDGGGVFGVTKGLAKEFGPERVRDTPISEEGIVAVAVGAATTGMRPVVELMYGDFLPLAMDPLVNQAAKLRYMFGGQAQVPMVLRSNVGAGGGKAAQHSQSLETWIMHVPGIKLVMPSTPYDAKGLLKTAIRDNNPVVFLEHKLLYFTKGVVPESDYTIPFGVASIRRSGKDCTVVAMQAMLNMALSVADKLAEESVELEVIDPRTLVPLDIDTIVESVSRTNRLVICHEATERGGWAGEIAMQVMERVFDLLDGPIVRVCGQNVPMPYSASLEEQVIPRQENLMNAVRQLLTEYRAPITKFHIS
jgi:acetoin:2,6-dichlorophenolindophenol oxidoreductase subunit beta